MIFESNFFFSHSLVFNCHLILQLSFFIIIKTIIRVVGIQPLLDMLSDHLWFASKPTSNEPIPTEPKDDELTESIFDKKTIEQRQRSTSGAASGIAREHKIGFHDVRELRAYVLFLFKQIITGRKDVRFDFFFISSSFYFNREKKTNNFLFIFKKRFPLMKMN